MTKLLDVIESFSNKKVLLIGDTIVDIYVYGTLLGTSAETPTLVAREKETKYSLGGAFLVARNMLELGANVEFVTMAGQDEGARLIEGFSHPKLTKHVVSDGERCTTVKKRFWVDGYKLLQFDNTDNEPVETAKWKSILKTVSDKASEFDAIVVSDYRHGLMTSEFIAEVLAIGKKANKPVIVDSQVSQSKANHTEYKGADYFCVNLKEARCVDPEFQPEPNVKSFAKLCELLKTKNVIVKLGEKGSLALLGNEVVTVDAFRINVVDTCGAGDAFLAALVTAGLDHSHMRESLTIANAWGGLSTTVHGTSPASKSELFKLLK